MNLKQINDVLKQSSLIGTSKNVLAHLNKGKCFSLFWDVGYLYCSYKLTTRKYK